MSPPVPAFSRSQSVGPSPLVPAADTGVANVAAAGAPVSGNTVKITVESYIQNVNSGDSQLVTVGTAGIGTLTLLPLDASSITANSGGVGIAVGRRAPRTVWELPSESPPHRIWFQTLSRRSLTARPLPSMEAAFRCWRPSRRRSRHSRSAGRLPSAAAAAGPASESVPRAPGREIRSRTRSSLISRTIPR